MSDATTHQPLLGATIQLFANHTAVATETSSVDGNSYLHFPYRLGTLLVVTATKQGYVPNSVPWSPSRLPGKCVCVEIFSKSPKADCELANFNRIMLS